MLTTVGPWLIPYSELTDPPDDPSQSKSWADRVATSLTTLNNSVTTASGNITTLQNQMTSLNTETANVQLWTTTSTTVWTASAISAPRTLTIPGGIFTQTPAVFCQIVEPTNAYYPWYRTHTVTTTSVTVSGTFSATSSSTWTFFLLALTYASTLRVHIAAESDPGPDPIFGAAVRRELVCDNPECPAAGEPVDVWTYAGATFACGSCGQDIALGD